MSDQYKYTAKLSGTRILIIGGSSGVGFAVAEASIEHGSAAVIISSSSPERINNALSRLRNTYPTTNCEIIGFPCDLRQEECLESNIEALIDSATLKGTKKLDHVIFTAGDQLVSKPLQQVDLGFIKESGMVRFFSPLLVAKHAAKHMLPSCTSSITLTTGASAQHPIPDWNVICSYAAGLYGMTRSLALDLKPLRVNIVCLGAVDTELVASYFANSSPEERRMGRDAFAKATATGAIGKPEDVAEAYLYAMKDHNLTATAIESNGGIFIV